MLEVDKCDKRKHIFLTSVHYHLYFLHKKMFIKCNNDICNAIIIFYINGYWGHINVTNTFTAYFPRSMLTTSVSTLSTMR